MSVGLLTTLRRRWRIALPFGVGFGWVMAGPFAGVSLMVDVLPEPGRLITPAAMLGAMVGCALGGLLFARWPGAAPGGGRWSLAAAGGVSLLLPLSGSAYVVPLALLTAVLHGLWVVAMGLAYLRQVPAAERGRTMGWGGFFIFLVIQLVTWVGPLLPARWVWAGMAGLLLIPILAAPGEADAVRYQEAQPEDAAWQYRLFPFILFAFVLGGRIQAVSAVGPTFAETLAPNLDLLVHAPACLLAGLALDRGRGVQVASGAVLAMGAGYGLQWALPGPLGAVALQEGTRLGIAVLGVFWWYQMAGLATRVGPAAAFAAGNVIEAGGLMIGAMIAPLVPTPVLGGMTVIALLAGMMLVNRLPDRTAGPAAAPGRARIDLAAVLGEVVQAPLTAREQEVSRLLLEGHSTAEIAEALYLSENTVRTHLKNIYRKADCGSRQELMSRLLERVAGEQAK